MAKPEYFQDSEPEQPREPTLLKKYDSIKSLGNFSNDGEVVKEINEGKLLCSFVEDMDRTETPSFLGPHIDTDRVPLLVHCT